MLNAKIQKYKVIAFLNAASKNAKSQEECNEVLVLLNGLCDSCVTVARVKQTSGRLLCEQTWEDLCDHMGW